MAFDGTVKVGTRGQLCDFILSESPATATRVTRKSIPVVAGQVPGQLVKADGTKATAVADIAGICLTTANAAATLTTDFAIQATAVVGGAGCVVEVKDLGFEATLTGSVAALAKLGIVVVPTGL